MKIRYISIMILFYVISSCSKNKLECTQSYTSKNSTTNHSSMENQEKRRVEKFDSIREIILRESKSSQDTLKYHFSIEDVGTEGNEGIAYYSNNKLQKVVFDIYTSMWKIHLLYNFHGNNVKVTEETYNIYSDIELVRKKSYLISNDGVPLGEVDSTRIDVFQNIKDNIPFKLR